MSNLWFNIRFGTYHWQWGPGGMRWEQNRYYVIQRKKNHEFKWFAVYCIFGHHL